MVIRLGKQEAWKRLCFELNTERVCYFTSLGKLLLVPQVSHLEDNGTHFRVEYEEETKIVFGPLSVIQVRGGTPSVLTSDCVSFTVRIKATHWTALCREVGYSYIYSS